MRTFSSAELEARVRGRAETATRVAKMVAMVRAGSRGVARSGGWRTSAVRGNEQHVALDVIYSESSAFAVGNTCE